MRRRGDQHVAGPAGADACLAAEDPHAGMRGSNGGDHRGLIAIDVTPALPREVARTVQWS